MAAAARRLGSGAIDAACGRADWVGKPAERGIEARPIRFEPLALLLPAGHQLAALDAVPLAALEGREIDANTDDPNAPEWTDLARQVLALAGARPTGPHPPAVGLAEASHHLVRQGLPILTGVDQVDIPGGVVRQIVAPTPLYPWSIVTRRGTAGDPGVSTLLEAADRIGAAEGWLNLPPDAWLPLPEVRGR